MSQKKTPWNSGKVTPSDTVMELATELGRRVNQEIYNRVSTKQDMFGNNPRCKSICCTKMWIPGGKNVGSTSLCSSPYTTVTDKPNFGNGIQASTRVKNRPFSVKTGQRVNNSMGVTRCPGGDKPRPHSVPVRCLKVSNCETGKGNELNENTKNIIRREDPMFDVLFVPGTELQSEEYSYPDPFPDDFLSFSGNTLKKMKYFKDDLYALKLIELQKVLNITLELERVSSNRSKTTNGVENPPKIHSNRGVLKKSQSCDVMNSDDLNNLTVACKSFHNLTEEYVNHQHGNTVKQCQNNKVQMKGSQSENLTATGKLRVQSCKSRKGSGGKEQSVGKVDGSHDPARVFRHSGMRKYLALQKLYWEEQVKAVQNSSTDVTERNPPVKPIKGQMPGVNSKRDSIKTGIRSEHKPKDMSRNSGQVLAVDGRKTPLLTKKTKGNGVPQGSTSAVELYDVKHMASTFEPPCQKTIKKRAKSAAIANSGTLQRGKGCHSDRKTSATYERRPKTGITKESKRR